jgi:Phosphotransferase enzyme family
VGRDPALEHRRPADRDLLAAVAHRALVREEPLVGVQSVGVVRVGDTVRRPPGPNAGFVRALLRLLEERGFDGAPRLLGSDEHGRDVLTFVEGSVPPGDDAGLTDEEVASAARLIRRFHDATAGSTLAGGEEVVAHADLGPHNTVFRDGRAVALIDWDGAHPGPRLFDLGHATWCFAEVGPDGGPIERQAARTRAFCEAYGWDDAAAVVAEIERYHRSAQARHEQAGRPRAAAIFAEEVAWIAANGPRITAVL